jgi:hypothetical protein
MSLKKIGVLWKKADKNGNEFYSGTVDCGVLGNVNLAVFPNTFKEGTQPDFIINLLENDEKG